MEKEWYYNTVTGNVEYGMLSPAEQRLGPYATREEAEHALDIARERNNKWEEDNEHWNAFGSKDKSADEK